MKPFSVATALVFLVFRSFAEQTLKQFPIGDEPFFRKEGAKLVRYVHLIAYANEMPNAEPRDEWYDVDGLKGWHQTGIGLGYVPANEMKEYTEAQLFQLGRDALARYTSGFRNTNALYAVRVEWRDGDDGIGAIPFRRVINFRLERDTRGNLRPPAWVTENLEMKIGRQVFARLESVSRVRLRWFDGKDFNDYSYPDKPASGEMKLEKTWRFEMVSSSVGFSSKTSL